MKYVQVTTPDNIDVEYRLAGAGARIGAVVIDTGIQVLSFIILLLIVFLFSFDLESFSLRIEDNTAGWVVAFLIITYFVVFFGYFLVCEMLMQGRSIGKAVFGLRVIRQNGQPITFVQSAIRNILRIFIDNYGLGMVLILFNKQNRRLGDMFAGTMVISENPNRINTASLKLAGLTEPSEYQLDLRYPLSAEEYELLKDYFARKDGFIDQGAAVFSQLKNYFGNKYSLGAESISNEFLFHILEENSRTY